MIKRASRFIVLALAIGVGAGCGNGDKDVARVSEQGAGFPSEQQYQAQGQPQYQQQAAPGQPVIINQPAPAANSGMGDMLLGGMMGYMMGSGGGSRERVVERHYETRSAAPTSSYRSAPAQQVASKPSTAPKATYSGFGDSSTPKASAPAKPSYGGWGSSSSSSKSSYSAPKRSSYSGFSSSSSRSSRR